MESMAADRGFDRRGHDHTRRSSNDWVPRSLSTPALVANAAIFGCFSIALGLLYHFARVGDGLHIISTSHYTWVYGPTAILIVLVSVWRQIDFHTKSLMPWSELQRGDAPADRSILLDYISRDLLTAFYKAAHTKHIPVMLTTAAFVVLKITTIASTGLFYESDVITSLPSVNLVKTNTLSSPIFNVSDPDLTNSTQDSSVFYMTHAITNMGFPQPEGVAHGMLYETFRQLSTSSIVNATYEAQVQAFYPEMMCEPLRVSAEISSIGINYITLHSEDDACQWQTFTMPFFPSEVDGRKCGNHRINADVRTSVCEDAPALEASQSGRVLFTLVDMKSSSLQNGTTPSTDEPVSALNCEFEIVDTKVMLCRVSYSIKPTRVIYRNDASTMKIEVFQNEDHYTDSLEGFTNEHMAREFVNALEASRNVFGDVNDGSVDVPNAYFGLMKLNTRLDYANFLNDTAVFMSAAQNVFTNFGVQIGRKFLFQPANELFNGTTVYREHRLLVQNVSFGLVLSGFLLISIAAVLMLSLRPTKVTQNSPTSVAYIATILRHSPSFTRQIQGLQDCDRTMAKETLRNGRYSSTINKTTNSTGILANSIISNPSSRATEGTRTWWEPMSLSWPFLTLTGLSAIIVIAALEGLQHKSDKSDGLVALHKPTSFEAGLYTRFLPAIIMSGVATLYNSLDFNALLLAPYSSMRARTETRAFVSESLLSKIPPVALYMAFKHRHWAACFTTIATLVGSVLTIVGSGLYTLEPRFTPTTLTLQRLDSWNINFPNSLITDNGAVLVSSLIESDREFMYPTHTYNELALPSLSIAVSANESTAGLLEARLPVLRAKLSCVKINPSNYNFSFVPYKGGGPYSTFLDVTIDLPSSCQRGGVYGNESTITFFPSLSGNTSFAEMTPIHVGPFDNIEGMATGEMGTLAEQPDNPPECPSLVFYYGMVDSVVPSRSVATVLYCNQELESMDANITLTFPDLEVSAANPPGVIEGSETLLRSGPSNETGFPWRLQQHFLNAFRRFSVNSTANTTDPFKASDSSPVDPFFQGVMYGRTPLSMEAIANGQDADLVFDHIHMMYRRYMAQFISANLRTQGASGQAAPTFQATFTPTAGGEQRLIQHRLPKLILQIMLAVMLACSVCAYLLAHFRRILPWNPCSIAGVAILIADSKLSQPPAKRVARGNVGQTAAGHNTSFPKPNTRNKWDVISPSVQILSEPRSKSMYSGPYLDRLGQLTEQRRNNASRDEVELSQWNSEAGSLISSHRGYVAYQEKDDVSEDDDDADSSTTAHVNFASARYRLGYWQDGLFMGTQTTAVTADNDNTELREHTYDVDPDEDVLEGASKWRYGIDFI